MTILHLILPLALVFAGAAVAAFAWTVRSGQLDDVETPPCRILFDDETQGRQPATPVVEMAPTLGSNTAVDGRDPVAGSQPPP